MSSCCLCMYCVVFQLNPDWLVANLKEMFLGAHWMNLSSYEPQKKFMILNEIWGAFCRGKNFSISQYPTFKLLRITIVGKIKFELLPTLLGTNISYLGKGKSRTQKCRLTQRRCDRFPGGYFMIRNGFQLQASCCSWSVIPIWWDGDFFVRAISPRNDPEWIQVEEV